MILPVINPVHHFAGPKIIMFVSRQVGGYALTLAGASLIALAVGLSQRVTLAWGPLFSFWCWPQR